MHPYIDISCIVDISMTYKIACIGQLLVYIVHRYLWTTGVFATSISAKGGHAGHRLVGLYMKPVDTSQYVELVKQAVNRNLILKIAGTRAAYTYEYCPIHQSGYIC